MACVRRGTCVRKRDSDGRFVKNRKKKAKRKSTKRKKRKKAKRKRGRRVVVFSI